MQQTGAQQRSPIPGKMQNCTEFGEYEPPSSPLPGKALCQGGFFEGEWYNPCPVREECRANVIAKKQATINEMQQKTNERKLVNPFTIPSLRGPGLPTQHPQARTAEQVKAGLNAAVDAAQRTVDAHTPRVVQPAKDAPPGMRTPFAAVAQTFGEVSPTFLPQEGESIWDRLWKNIVQGLISTIGWHIYNMARVIDFFG